MEGAEAIYRREADRVLATLIRLLGDFDLAEEARQEAFAVALEQWPREGVPANPRAWLVNVGRNKAVDQIRRRARLVGGEGLEELPDETPVHEDAAFGDDRLRLIFTCCHPSFAMEAQVALTLRVICGLSTSAVARAFLVSEETMAQRLARAKRKIKHARIPYETPEAALLDERVDGVLAVLYLVFTEGYAGTSGEELISAELCHEAIRLARLLDALLPGRAPILGLLALLLLHDARRKARVTAAGDIVLLEDQDRSRWDQGAIAEGLGRLERALHLPGRVSPYTVQAAIAALHVQAPRQEDTDWRQIVGLYEVLLHLQPTPVIELNRAVAVSMVDGPERALQLVDAIAARGGIRDYHRLHAARGRLLQKLGRDAEARAAYEAALTSVRLAPERRLLELRLRELG